MIPPSLSHEPWLEGLVFSSVLLMCGSIPKQDLWPSEFLPQEKFIIQFHVHILNAY